MAKILGKSDGKSMKKIPDATSIRLIPPITPINFLNEKKT